MLNIFATPKTLEDERQHHLREHQSALLQAQRMAAYYAAQVAFHQTSIRTLDSKETRAMTAPQVWKSPAPPRVHNDATQPGFVGQPGYEGNPTK